MKNQQIALTLTTDAQKNEITYGTERGTPWMEIRERRDRWVVYGNCRSNMARIISDIAVRGVKVSSEFMVLLTLTA
jgi:hypothetical protein